MAEYRDESDFDWDHSSQPSDEELQPVVEAPPPQMHHHHHHRTPTTGETLAEMRTELVQVNAVIKHCTDTANGITQISSVQAILGELQGREREQALRLANAVGDSAFQHFFDALLQLDSLTMSLYRKEQQLETALYRQGRL
jgi:hypothetical protein